jgi:RNA polymerase sigma factor (sigma-70 family)
MTTIYFKDGNGQKITVGVSEAVAEVYRECRRAEWRNDAKERYYRGVSLDMITDKDSRLEEEAANPERLYIAAEERAEQRERLKAVLKALTAEQLRLVRMLKSGITAAEIAGALNISKSAVSQRIDTIHKKFKEFLK